MADRDVVLPPPPVEQDDAGEKTSWLRRTAKDETGKPEPADPAPATSGPSVRKARLRLVQVEPWSVMKTSFLLSVALGIVTVVAVAIVWSVLGMAGLWDSVNSIVRDSIGDKSGSPFEIQKYLGTSRVLGFTMIVAVLDVILITAIATVSAFLYNLAATLLGGIEVTFAEDR
jgi:hypothetical protein